MLRTRQSATMLTAPLLARSALSCVPGQRATGGRMPAQRSVQRTELKCPAVAHMTPRSPFALHTSTCYSAPSNGIMAGRGGARGPAGQSEFPLWRVDKMIPGSKHNIPHEVSDDCLRISKYSSIDACRM